MNRRQLLQFRGGMGRGRSGAARGENLSTKSQFADLNACKGVHVVQPDNRRAGGVTEWMVIAAITDAHGLELTSHGCGATNLNMLLAMPNAIYMETGGAHKLGEWRDAGARGAGHEQRSFPAEIQRYRV
jgi:L-alanine-DL-glutamate epimerase-like enolase superfamily enzyme